MEEIFENFKSCGIMNISIGEITSEIYISIVGKMETKWEMF